MFYSRRKRGKCVISHISRPLFVDLCRTRLKAGSLYLSIPRSPGFNSSRSVHPALEDAGGLLTSRRTRGRTKLPTISAQKVKQPFLAFQWRLSWMAGFAIQVT